MIVTVHYLGDEFVAYDDSGTRITNRSILEQLSFEPFPAYKGILTFNIPVDEPPQELSSLDIKINIDS